LLTALIVRLVEMSRRYAWSIVALALAISILLGWFAATHFKINTDINQLLSSDLPWRQRDAEMEKAFPQKVDTLLVVIDGDTPDAAENAASKLTEALRTQPDKFTSVERPDNIPFFRKNGLLFLDPDKLSDVLDQLIQAQPLLAVLAADPSLRGMFHTLDMVLQGLEHGAVEYDKLDKPFTATAETLEAAMQGQDKPLAWQALMSPDKPTLRDLRKLIIVKPVLDYGVLEPGKAASDAIRAIAAGLHLTPGNGVHVRLSGSVPLNDEEFASVANGTGFATILSAVLVLVILLLALRSLRLVIPILLSLVAGLIATTAFALAVIGSLNLISVAFAVMFIGIAVDFGIQFGVRYRDQHHQEPDHAKAMSRTATIIALPLAMAAGSTSLGFFSFIPTSYRGVAELGTIAGAGMLIAFAFTILLLPALLTLFKPPAEPENVGFRWAAPIDAFLMARRKQITIIVAVTAIIALGLASQVKFDFDPLDLKDPHTESVSTLFDLMKDPDFSTYTIDVLRPSLAEADALADKLKTLPEVDHVMTLSSFVPDKQDAKLAAIADTRTILIPTLDPPTIQPPPSDIDIAASLHDAAESLHKIGAEHPSAERLATDLDKAAARGDHDLLQRLNDDLIGGMLQKLKTVRESLDVAAPVTADSITDDLRRDWVLPDGRALIEVYPKGNPRDHKTLKAFTGAVRAIAPDAGGSPISIQESGQTVTKAFIYAGCYALAAISLLALFIMRRPGDVLRLIAPLLLAGILSLATMFVIGLPLNFANIIALPLLLSLGVSYSVYFVSYWRTGMANPLQSSMARAVLFSAATTLVAFGSLSISSHPGTRGMGDLLTVALLYSLTCTFFVLPVLLGRPKIDRP
jgi:hopanoid biosynthesis associated RND transporter like protein HpnN